MSSLGDRRRGDSGATLVEFALIAPILFLLLFGIIEFGAAFNDFQSVRQGAREGARNAVVADYGTSTSCGLNGAAAGLSGTAGTNTQKVICTVKEQIGLGNLTRVKVIFTDNTPDFANDRVKVCAVNQFDSITGFIDPFIDGRNLRTEIEMRVEKEVVLSSSDETDPSGSSWSWC